MCRLFFGAGSSMFDIRMWRDLGVLTLDASHRQPCGEHGEEAIGVKQQRDPIRERDESKSKELVESNRLAVDAPQMDHELPDAGLSLPESWYRGFIEVSSTVE